jgi:hypothetical protein
MLWVVTHLGHLKDLAAAEKHLLEKEGRWLKLSLCYCKAGCELDQISSAIIGLFPLTRGVLRYRCSAVGAKTPII